MATLLELHGLSQNQDLLTRITAAIAILAENIRIEHQGGSPAQDIGARFGWAARAVQNPEGEARKIIWLILAKNKNYTVAQITGASDAAIMAAVEESISLFQ